MRQSELLRSAVGVQPTDPLGALGRRRCRVTVEPVAGDASPDDVVRALANVDGLVCLWGEWADGSAVITWAPEFVVTDASALGTVPIVMGPRVSGAHAGAVAGGWFGRLGYDADTTRWAFHDHVLRRHDGRWSFEALHSPARSAALAAARTLAQRAVRGGPAPAVPASIGTFHAADPSVHLAATEQAIELIRAGELYQVNVCTRLHAPWRGNPTALFTEAAARLQPAYGALLMGGDRAVVSLSPELFLRRRGRAVATAPIKGTLPRGGNDANAAALRRSSKDVAENVMIVDLMRNDLGRVCRVGSVRVPELLEVQPHPGVWHLVSTVTGRLRDDVDDGQLLKATFPPGSVTGAPKHRALQAIDTLEQQVRGVYTGAIGFASPCWGLELSVAIRTFEVDADRVELGVGGGITADSVPMLEWHECLHKAAPLLGVLGARLDPALAAPPVVPSDEQLAGGLTETILALDGVPVRAADQLARLDRSCRELYGSGIGCSSLAAEVAERARGSAGRVLVRVLVRPVADGLTVRVSAAAAPMQPGAAAARVALRSQGSWRHRWAECARPEESGATSLLVAEDGTVLETGRGNILLLLDDGTLVTPPLREDVVPGITRRALLDLARDRGRPTQVRGFGLGALPAAAAVFCTSSIAGITAITAVDTVPLRRADGLLGEFARELGLAV